MSYTVWRFQYSVQERIEALKDILVEQGTFIRPSHVKREWLYRAQLLLEPAGWYALWRLPRESCKKFGIRFPCIVYVMVEGLELNEDALLAQIEVIGVQDESVHLPERALVPLLELWATRAQPNTALEIRPTAEFIDMYRYFYTVIWMPWDLEEDEQDNGQCWFLQHVPARCELWASASNGQNGDPNALQALRNEGELIRQHIAQIEETMSSDNEEQIDVNSEHVSALVGLHERLQNVRVRWEMLQNPLLQNMCNVTCNVPLKNQNEITVVWTGGAIQSHIACLKQAEDCIVKRKMDKKKKVGCASSLTDAMNPKPSEGSIILLCEGSHEFPTDTNIGNNFTLAAVNPKCNSTIIKSPEFCTTAMSISGSAELFGITIDPAFSTTAVAIRQGKLTMETCFMTSPANSQIQSVVVHPKAEIIFKQCIIKGFFTGIIAHNDSKVTLIDCVFEDCGVAIQAYEQAQLSLIGCQFKNHSEAAIRYETSQAPGTSVGGTNLLQGHENIGIENCIFSTTGKNEVCITHLDDFACPQIEAMAL